MDYDGLEEQKKPKLKLKLKSLHTDDGEQQNPHVEDGEQQQNPYTEEPVTESYTEEAEQQFFNYEPPKDYKVWSIINIIVSILFCCSCCGIISLVLSIIAMTKSNEVGRCLAMGEAGLPVAQEASKNAKLFNLISTILLILDAICHIAYLAIYGISTIAQQANM